MIGTDMMPWCRLSDELRADGHYNAEGLDAQQLMNDCLRGMAVVGWDKSGTRITAHGVVVKSRLGDTWQIRKLFVAGDHRGNGNGSAAIDNIVRRLLLIPVCQSPTHFAITDNPKVVNVLEGHRFQLVRLETMPDVAKWAKLTGVYGRLPASLRGDQDDGRHLLVRWPMIRSS